MSSEPLLTDARLNLFPIQYPDIWDMYQKAKAAYWVPEEVDLSQDVGDWESLDSDEKHFLLMVFAFFAGSDLLVNENLDCEFTELVKVPELKMIYHFQEMMEDIHTAQYQTIIEALVKDSEMKSNLLQSTLRIPSIQAKADWARKYITDGSFVQRLLAFSIVEGIFFSASFCSIFWVKKRGILRGVCQSNEFIARDEGMHRDLAVLLYRNYIVNKLPEETVIQMIKDAVNVEREFIKACLPYQLTGMNKELMSQYVEYVADRLCADLVERTIYNVENPFMWMNLISMEGKTNFFEKKVSNYSRASVLTAKEENTIAFDADF
jgi:ribonucleoside-diphosphate reductase beta chain